LPNRIAGSPKRIADTPNQVQIAKSIRQMDLANRSGVPAFMQHINRLQIKFAIQIGLLKASM
jgi:hypothetical protein